MDWFFILALFLYGAVLGSFLNVCIYRIPQKISVIKGRSFCTSCDHQLKWNDLFPVFSYLFLGRKCRYCGQPISPRYMLVELLTGVLWALSFPYWGLGLETALICFAACLLVVSVFMAWDGAKLPTSLWVLLVVCALLLNMRQLPWAMGLWVGTAILGLLLRRFARPKISFSATIGAGLAVGVYCAYFVGGYIIR